MRTDSENKNGFTIVELVMVTAIIAFIATIGAASYRQGERRIVLDNQTFQFMQDVRRAQERALSSRDTGAAAPRGYGIYLPHGVNYYLIYADKDNSKSYDAGEETEQISLDGKITISDMQVRKSNTPWTNANSVDINYAAPDLTTRITKGGDKYEEAKVVFSVANGSQTRTAAANIAGLVYVE